MKIHPTAIVDPSADLAPGVSVGPMAIIESGARIGEECRIEARASIKTGVTLGPGNTVCEGAVIGGLPQHIAPPGPPGTVAIGSGSVFRENCTVHRAMQADAVTRIGDSCMLMVGAHVAHDCLVGDHVILANNVMLAGHVSVGDRAFLGGGCAVHQHCRVGRIAMIGGLARVIQDVPPFVTIDGRSGAVVGLNRVGLRRAGLTRGEMADVKEAYQVLYRSGLSFEERLAALSEQFEEGPASELGPFLRETSRGFARERRDPPGGTIRVIDAADRAGEANEPAAARRAG
ncbi:acyl-ACP--UDP-N-acetylglucosamine O-acyltransferase [Botrimarina sp.]|uniref:acyl-ACP--UDP-N-acetylglucosamine O-acyltransferase n=1 Tax=Botrimarina sp. TaxID=2795802 RepID=UPI0032EB976C